MQSTERPLFRKFLVRRAAAFVVLVLLALTAAAIVSLVRVGNGTRLLAEGQAGATEVLYLSPSRQPELWVTSIENPQAVPLTNTAGSVYDYAVSSDGAWIAFSARNEQGGYDLWEITRRGAGRYDPARMVLPCGTDWCTGPAYQPGGDRIAYSRRRASGLPGAQPGTQAIWIFDRATQQTDVLYVDPNIGGSSAAWSPDGRYLAFVDDFSQIVRVADMQGQAEVSIPAGEGAAFAWSPDSQRLLVARSAQAHEHPYTLLVMYEMSEGQESVWLDDSELDASVPAWSPDGETLAVARRLVHDGPGKQIWLLNPDGSWLQAVTENPLANHAAYRWSPDGAQLLFQRLEFGSSSSLPEVLLWDRGEGRLTVLAEDAFQPGWVR